VEQLKPLNFASFFATQNGAIGIMGPISRIGTVFVTASDPVAAGLVAT
jgi:hypothetical protein